MVVPNQIKQSDMADEGSGNGSGSVHREAGKGPMQDASSLTLSSLMSSWAMVTRSKVLTAAMGRVCTVETSSPWFPLATLDRKSRLVTIPGALCGPLSTTRQLAFISDMSWKAEWMGVLADTTGGGVLITSTTAGMITGDGVALLWWVKLPEAWREGPAEAALSELSERARGAGGGTGSECMRSGASALGAFSPFHSSGQDGIWPGPWPFVFGLLPCLPRRPLRFMALAWW